VTGPDMPKAEAAEDAVLGACFADPGVLEAVAHLVAPGDFSSPARTQVWAAILSCRERAVRVDHLTVSEALKAAGQLSAVGGPAYLMRLDMRVPLVSNVAQYARQVVEASQRRRAVSLALEAAHRAADVSVPLEAVLSQGAESWQQLHASVPHLKEGQDLFVQVLDEVEAAGRGELTTCIPTGIEPWDDAMAGITLGELTFVLSQPGVGKSTVFGTMLKNLAIRAAAAETRRTEAKAKRDAGEPYDEGGLHAVVDDVGVFSKEDLGTWIPRRHISQGADIPLFILQKGFVRTPFTREQMERFAVASGEVWNFSAHYVVDDRNMLTVDQVIQSAREMIRRRKQQGRKLRVLFLDHIGKMNHEIPKHGGKEDLAIEHTLNRLSQFAKQENVGWVIAVHGKEREDGSKYMKPKLNSFARTAYFERDARVAVGLYLDKDDDSVLLATVLKQTNGPPDVGFRMFRAKTSALVLNQNPDKGRRAW
jgi:replicative DNA helicase